MSENGNMKFRREARAIEKREKRKQPPIFYELSIPLGILHIISPIIITISPLH